MTDRPVSTNDKQPDNKQKSGEHGITSAVQAAYTKGVATLAMTESTGYSQLPKASVGTDGITFGPPEPTPTNGPGDGKNPSETPSHHAQPGHDGSSGQPERGSEAGSETPADAQAQALAQQYGLGVSERTQNGKTTYTYTLKGVDGKPDQTVLTTDQAGDNAQRQLDGLLQQRESDISSKYHVKIAQPGSHATNYNLDSNGKEVTSSTTTRQPRFDELQILDSALAASAPSGAGTNIEFITDSSNFAAAWRSGDDIVITPGATAEGRNPGDVRGTLLHELAHHGQDAGRGFNADETAAGYGWTKLNNGDYALKGKDGNWYQMEVLTDAEKQSPEYKAYVQSHPNDEHADWVWYRVDPAGNPVDKNNHEIPSDQRSGFNGTRPVPKDLSQSVFMHNGDMIANATVKPPTDYFPNVYEEDAEGKDLLRQGQDARMRFLQSNPQGYAAAKASDQREIDKGAPAHIRGLDGQLVANTPENQAAIQQAEDTAKQWAFNYTTPTTA